MIVWKVTHTYRKFHRSERKSIGVYSSPENARNAIDVLKTKEGFKDNPTCFKTKRAWKWIKPRSLDKTFWVDGYTTYTYVPRRPKA